VDVFEHLAMHLLDVNYRQGAQRIDTPQICLSIQRPKDGCLLILTKSLNARI